jgi:hypothetical protein
MDEFERGTDRTCGWCTIWAVYIRHGYAIRRSSAREGLDALLRMFTTLDDDGNDFIVGVAGLIISLAIELNLVLRCVRQHHSITTTKL